MVPSLIVGFDIQFTPHPIKHLLKPVNSLSFVLIYTPFKVPKLINLVWIVSRDVAVLYVWIIYLTFVFLMYACVCFAL